MMHSACELNERVTIPSSLRAPEGQGSERSMGGAKACHGEERLDPLTYRTSKPEKDQPLNNNRQPLYTRFLLLFKRQTWLKNYFWLFVDRDTLPNLYMEQFMTHGSVTLAHSPHAQGSYSGLHCGPHREDTSPRLLTTGHGDPGMLHPPVTSTPHSGPQRPHLHRSALVDPAPCLPHETPCRGASPTPRAQVPEPGLCRLGGGGTHGRDGVGVGRQGLEALPCLHVPYPHALIKLKVDGEVTAVPRGGAERMDPQP